MSETCEHAAITEAYGELCNWLRALGEPRGDDAADELTRLRSLLEDLVRAVEPFATDAMFLNGIAGTCPLRVPEYVDVEDHELGSTIGDLRRAREAYLKAHSHTEKETG